MGEVIPLNRQQASSPAKKPSELALPLSEALTSRGTVRRVRKGIARLFNLEDFTITNPPRIGFAGNIPQGTVHEVIDKSQLKSKRLVGVVTSPAFPEYLVELGLSQKEAVELAADFTLAYGIAFRGLLRCNVTQMQGNNLKPELWHPSYISPALALPYRLAGTVALHTQGIRPLGSDQPAPQFYPHIAGLHNPLAREQVATFHSVMKQGSIE
jgi:hypothetical protein